MEHLPNVTIAVCGIGVIILLVGFLLWYGTFSRIRRHMLFVFLGSLVGSGGKDDPFEGKPFNPAEEPERLSDIMEDKASALDFDASVARHREAEGGPPAVIDPLSENLEVQAAEDDVNEASQRAASTRDTRPFRFSRLRPGRNK